MSIKERMMSKSFSRRELIGTAGKMAAGAAIATAGGLSLPKMATAASAEYPWPYKKLDPEAVAERAYHRWYKDYCSMAVADGLIGTLQEKVGGPWKNFPLQTVRFAHGGVAGWGTLCGTMFGAATATSLVAGVEDGDHIINDVLYWYSITNLPTYTPAKPKLAQGPITTRADSPLCHVSVSTWMSKAGVEFFTPERKDRCARVAASVAQHTATLLNAWADDDYEPVHSSNMRTHNRPAQNNCLDCHGG